MSDFKTSKNKHPLRSFVTKCYKICLGTVATLSIFALTLFFLTPTIASSNWGKEKIEEFLSEKINGKVLFKNLHLTFWGSQEIEGLRVNDLDGNLMLDASLITIDTSFPELFFHEILENRIRFLNANLMIGKSKSGATIQDVIGLDSNHSKIDPKITPLSPITLKNMEGDISLSSPHLILKLNGLTIQDELEGAFDFDISLKGIDPKRRLELLKTPDLLFSDESNLRVNITATDFPIALIDFALKTKNPEYKDDLLVTAFGKKLDLTLSKSKTDENKNLTLELKAMAGNLTANLVGEIGLDKIFTTKPSTLCFSLNQELIDQFYPDNLSLKLARPTTAFIAIEEFSLPLNLKTGEYDLLDLMFKGRVDLDNATLVSNIGLPDIELKKFTTAIYTEQSSEEVAIKVKGDASQRGQPIQVALETSLPKSLNFKKHKFPPLKLDLKHIPIAMIDHFFDLDQTLSNAIGTHADLQMEALVEKDRLDLQFKFDSEKLSIPSMIVKIDDNITLTTAPTLYYKVDEALAQTILPKSAVVKLNTDKPVTITLHVDPIQNFDDLNQFLTSNFSGNVTIHDVTFDSKERKQSISFQDVNIPWELFTIKQEANIRFSGKTKYLSEKAGGAFSGNASFKKEDEVHAFTFLLDQKSGVGKESQIQFEGNVARLFTDDGHFNSNGLMLNLDATVQNLPTHLFCKVACLDSSMHKKIQVLFGDFVSADVHVALKELNGLVQAKVNGDEGNFNLDSTIQDGLLFLNQPFEAQFKATARLGKSILHDIFPILGGVVSSDQPILFSIANDGFVFPLKRLDITKIEIPQATLSLGHVKFDNSGELAKVLSLLTSPNADLISVWFTPLYFTMHEGVFKLERVDMLISHRFPIATWGTVDLVQDKVKMTFGMSGYALKHAFNVKGLDNEYMVQLPFSGTTSSATINKASATTKIGALVAQGQGGPKGLVLGTVLSLAGGALTEEKPPKSTTLPLPWADELRENLVVAEEAAEELKKVEDDEQIVAETKSQGALTPKKKRKKHHKFKINEALENEILDLFKH